MTPHTRTPHTRTPHTRTPHEAISRLLATYAERIDAGDFDGVAELFEHGEIRAGDGSVVAAGRDQVRALYERTTRRYDDGTPKTKHLVTNIVVDVDPAGTRASARSTFVVLQAVPGELALQPIIAGTYADRFATMDLSDRPDAPGASTAGDATDPGSWRFTSRQMHVDLVGDLGRHLLFELP